ncbi:MAG: polyketide biosynthesis protein [Alphaproteobacteria bacterium HGW-Alphaproteobacteria-8]|jgi:predicted DsbA family dithiol-disulfide isomerase|nr:MAG: polyketide biosynthesis protein [Alphaproteobacteria bacterium HGW-Alphaproteobacteria-8]
MVTLTIISDPICPWCLIGKTRLDAALSARPDHPFRIVWRPFQLNPDMPPRGADRRAYLEAKFGGPSGAARVYGAIAQTAAQDGLTLNFDGIARTPNTIDAHRVIRWAGDGARQHALAQALFEAYFQRGLDIGAPDVLADAAAAVGMDRALIAARLATDEDRAAIRAQDAQAREMGVTGVPAFVIADRYRVSGAQPTDFWLRAIDEFSRVAAAQEG